MNDLKIHDIKPLVEVPDYSLYIFIFILLSLILLLIFFIYFLYKKFKNKKNNQQKNYIKKIKNIDLSESKMAAYEISKYITLIRKNEQQADLANELIKELTQYKYKKEVELFSETTLCLYKKFTDVL